MLRARKRLFHATHEFRRQSVKKKQGKCPTDTDVYIVLGMDLTLITHYPLFTYATGLINPITKPLIQFSIIRG
jgi:hypothetical protein